ncbi:MAG: P-type conjugative transfer ATPase TrbB, partial [Candidatus Accumulibacter phosphatis]
RLIQPMPTAFHTPDLTLARTPEGRCVQEIIEVSGYEDGRYITRPL